MGKARSNPTILDLTTKAFDILHKRVRNTTEERARSTEDCIPPVLRESGRIPSFTLFYIYEAAFDILPKAVL